jgi:hypothetical protein
VPTYLCVVCGRTFSDYNEFIAHYYQHYTSYYPIQAQQQSDAKVSDDLPNTEEDTQPKFKAHRVADEIMESFQLVYALRQLESVATEDERKILKKLQRVVLDDFFEQLTEDAGVVMQTSKNSLKRELETWKENEEKRKKELEQKEESEKTKRKKKTE